MKIKSNLLFNTSLLARHTAKDKDKIVIGGALPEYMIIPAGATIDLHDLEWLKFASAAKAMLASGKLSMIVAPELSEEAQAKADAQSLADAQAVIDRLAPAKPVK